MKMKRKIILQEIFEHFQQMTQWATVNPDSYSKYYHKAESLIELLEVQDCGSIGGFDRKNPHKKNTGLDLYDRFLTLMNKTKQRPKLESICGFTPLILAEYFKSLNKLRENTLKRF
jgi:hypothetical protein